MGPTEETQNAGAPVDAAPPERPNHGLSSDAFAQVYQELRRLAAAKLYQENPGHTLSATALVHEAYIKLSSESERDWTNRTQFVLAAAEAMRRILIDHARAKLTDKRGGGAAKFPILEGDRVSIPDPDTLLTIEDTLDDVEQRDATAAQVARLRLFAGLTFEESAEALGVSCATAHRSWLYARACMVAALKVAH